MIRTPFLLRTVFLGGNGWSAASGKNGSDAALA